MADPVNAVRVGKESFERLIYSCRNQHIAAGIAPLIVFRQEVVTNDAFQSRNGIDTVTANHFKTHLINADRLRRRVTYNPDQSPIGDQIAKALDASAVVEVGVKPSGGDEVQGQAGRLFDLPWAFDGSDPDLPMLSSLKMSAPGGILLLNGIDIAIVEWSRLESRLMSRYITVMDSMRIYGQYQQLLTFLTDFAGDENMVDVVNPLPSAEPLGPDSSANRRTEPTAITVR